jgi:hypothetical protein
LHQWLVAQSAGAFNAEEAAARAIALLPPERSHSTGKTTIAMAVAPGPSQAIIRPSELEAPALQRHITQAAMFGPSPIFTTAVGTTAAVENHTLRLAQEATSFSLDEQGSMLIVRELSEGNGNGMLAVIQEDVEALLESSMTFACEMLDHIDSTHRLTHMALAVNLYEASHRGWRTRAQHAAQPSSGTMNMIHGESRPILLQPAHRLRGSLARDAATMAQDFAVLLRRNWTKG